MELKQCDRCKKTVNEEAEIGVALQMFTIIPQRGYIRPSQKLLAAARETNAKLEYFPLEWERHLFGEIDLCRSCFGEFMKFTTTV